MNIRGTFILILIVLSVVTPNLLSAQGSWSKVSVPTEYFLRSVYFTDSLYGWAAGDSGTMLHTINGGSDWSVQNGQTKNDIMSVFFLNRNLGWASAFNYTLAPYGTELLKTTNGGDTWTLTGYPVENIFMTCITYFDSLTGWMGGRPHALVKTTDGGATWHQAAIDTSTLAFFPVLSITFYNEKYGWASGGMFDIAGVIWRTSDGGNKWYAIPSQYAPADEVHALYAFDSLHVMGAGGDPDFGYGVGIIRTSDGGSNWQYQELGMPGFAVDLDFRNGCEGWAPLGNRKKFIYSLDAGTTWKDIYTPDSTAIFDVIFPDSLHGFAVGAKGAFLKYSPPQVPFVNPVNGNYCGYSLDQNFPNPFNTSTTISFSIPPGIQARTGNAFSTNPVKIRVCDLLGHTIAIFDVSDFPPGENRITFSGAGMRDGVYIGRLEGGNDGSILLTKPVRMLILGSVHGL
ncbi:MAG: YCF48-related protein [bacterium]